MAPAPDGPRFVPVITAYDLVEHAEITSLLEGEGLRVFRPPGDTTGLTGMHENFEIHVHVDDEEEALRVLEREGFFDEGTPAPPETPEVKEKKERKKGQDLVLAAMLFILLAILFGVLPRI